MEDQDPPIDAHLRGKALLMSIDLYKVWVNEGHVSAALEHQLEDILDVAQRFFSFLKGETK